MIVTGEGQIQKGDTLQIVGKNTRDDQIVTAEEIIEVSGNEEVILNKRRNYYFITKLLSDGKSWAKQVQILKRPANSVDTCNELDSIARSEKR